MADYVKTITNGVNVFGGKLSTKWGNASHDTFVFGTSKWGQGVSLVTEFTKVYGDSVSPSTTLIKDTEKLISDLVTTTDITIKEIHKILSDSTVITTDIIKDSFKFIQNTLAIDADLSLETKAIGEWEYIYDNSTNLEFRDASVWASASVATPTYTTISAGPTSWVTAI